jgi:hypothetical protein
MRKRTLSTEINVKSPSLHVGSSVISSGILRDEEVQVAEIRENREIDYAVEMERKG